MYAKILVPLDGSELSEKALAFFIMARVPGLVAQAYEEQMRQLPMRRIDPRESEYDGAEARELRDA